MPCPEDPSDVTNTLSKRDYTATVCHMFSAVMAPPRHTKPQKRQGLFNVAGRKIGLGLGQRRRLAVHQRAPNHNRNVAFGHGAQGFHQHSNRFNQRPVPDRDHHAIEGMRVDQGCKVRQRRRNPQTDRMAQATQLAGQNRATHCMLFARRHDDQQSRPRPVANVVVNASVADQAQQSSQTR